LSQKASDLGSRVDACRRPAQLFKVELRTRDALRVDRLLFAGNSLDKARAGRPGDANRRLSPEAVD
jgi:hypothetical protein